MPKKLKSGQWLVDVRPGGTFAKRIRKRFHSYAEANRYEAYVMGQAAQGLPWNPGPADNRRLADLVEKWFEIHGALLNHGKGRLVILKNITEALGNPIARNVTEEDFMTYRARLAKAGFAPKTLNNQLGYLNAVYNQLHRAKVIDYRSPIQSLAAIKYEKREMEYLTEAQMLELLTATANDYNPDVYLCTLLCLETGARWGEAQGLRRNMLREHGATFSVTFCNTKGKKTRTVPIREALFVLLREHRKPEGQVFMRCMRQFDRIAENLSFELPPRQATHILRHTFASHYMMNGGNILTLQKILGHADIKETMRYAHLAPSHLESAVALGPLHGHNLATLMPANNTKH